MIDPSLIKLLKSKASLDESAQANEMINRLIADNSRINTELNNKHMTVQTLLVDNARLQLDISALKGDLRVSNLHIDSSASERSSLMKELAAEKVRNNQFAEEQIFNANRDKCRIYQLEREVELLKERLSRQQQLSFSPPQNATNDFVTHLAPPAPPSMSQSSPVKVQPLIPIAKKAAFSINLSPPANTKRKEPDDLVAEQSGSSQPGSPAKIVKEASKTNGLLIFPLRDARKTRKMDLALQSETTQKTPTPFG